MNTLSPDRNARFEAWRKEVEQMLGHALNGDLSRDGYSLDFALNAFDDGAFPAEFVEEVGLMKRGVEIGNEADKATREAESFASSGNLDAAIRKYDESMRLNMSSASYFTLAEMMSERRSNEKDKECIN